jgi:hypothetical protein
LLLGARARRQPRHAKALIALAGKRIQELEAEEVDRRLTEIMPPEINDLG